MVMIQCHTQITTEPEGHCNRSKQSNRVKSKEKKNTTLFSFNVNKIIIMSNTGY